MRVENNIPEGWVETSIGTVTVVESGGTPSTKNSLYWSDEIPWITPRDLSSFKGVFIEKGERSISIEGLDNSSAKLLPKNTILFSSRAPIGYVVIAKNETATNQGFKNLICDEVNSHFKYFYYLMKYKADLIERLSSGSTFSEASGTLIKSIEINLPPLPEQKAIAKILTAFDNKIELLQAQNKTLETMAQTIFKDWFGKYQIGDELPEGWEFCELNDVVSKSNTGADAIQKAPIVSENTGVRCIRIGDLSKNRSYNYWGFTKVTDKNFKQFQLKKFDIVVTRTSILGLNKLIMEDLNAVYNNGLIKISLVKNISPYFIYGYFKSKVYRDYINMINNDTSTRPNMKIDYLLRFPIIIPTKDMEIKYSKIMESVMLKISKNTTQIQSLTKTRDTLLPKLMSGKVRVNNIKQTSDA